jgi:nucleoside phosphorylase
VGRVVLLAPMSVELAPLARRLGLCRRRLGAELRGAVGVHDVVAVRCGVGTARASEVTQAAIIAFSPDHVVVAGVAGGLQPTQRPGELIVAAEVVDLDRGRRCSARTLGGRRLQGRLVTSGLLHGWEQLAAHGAAGTLAVDMETAAVADRCASAGVPWTAYRGLSDLVAERTVDATTLALVREDGSTDLPATMALLARNPAVASRLARLARATAAAMSAVGGALIVDLRP